MNKPLNAITIILTVVTFLGSVPVIFARQSETEPAPGTAPGIDAITTVPPLRTLAERLTELTPEQPAAYFNLAEELFDERQFELATRLFVLAAHLDTPRFGRSACLGIAAIAGVQQNPERARQMRAMARMFPSTAGSDLPNNTNTTNASRALGFEENTGPDAEYRHAGTLVSAFLGFYRTGFGKRALKTLDLDSQTYAILTEYERAIGNIANIFEYCRNNTRCQLCQNTLYVELPEAHQRRQEHQNDTRRNQRPLDPRAEFEVCPNINTYRPQISLGELKRLLNIETALAGGTKARWGAQLALDRNKTRPILDPAFLPRMLNLDPEQTIYRDGRWQAPESGTE